MGKAERRKKLVHKSHNNTTHVYSEIGLSLPLITVMAVAVLSTLRIKNGFSITKAR